MTGWVTALFAAADAREWDELVSTSGSGTILHSTQYLGYHGSRFVDRSLVIRAAGGRLAAVFPAAESPEEETTVVSHPGVTFGGMLTGPEVTGAAYASLMAEALATWARMGYRELIYKAVPYIYHRVPRQEDTYVLWRLGCWLSRRMLSASVDLTHQLPVSKRRKRSLAKARAFGCEVRQGYNVFADFWPVAESALQERHNAQPVHSLEEIQYLGRCFPSNIDCLGAYIEGELVAGVVLFTSQRVAHVQYSLSSSRGLKVGAMDLLVDHAISKSLDQNARYFDFGISTDHSGEQLNEGLHRFKMEFGAGTVVYEQYKIALARDV